MTKTYRIADVASAAGVSPTTVSHALSGNRAVSEKTRGRVLDVAKALDYHPNQVARSLRSQTTHSVALLLVDIANPYYPVVARAIHDILAQDNYISLIGNTGGDREAERALLREMVVRRVDGIIVQPMSLSAHECREIVGASMPLVLITSDRSELLADQVCTDDARGVAEALQYLISQGRSEIGFITGPRGQEPGDARLEAFRIATRKHALDVPPSWIEHAAFTRDGGFTAGTRILGQQHRPKAIMCANDLIAIGVMDAARDAALAIPQELAVVGFDDIEIANLVTPRLTTVLNPAALVGSTCAELFLRRIEAGIKTPHERIVLPTRLVRRQSA